MRGARVDGCVSNDSSDQTKKCSPGSAVKGPITGSSWGRYPKRQQTIRPIVWQDELSKVMGINAGSSILPYGRGRSYGDVCLNSDGMLLDVASLDRVVEFDRVNGVITAEAGITLRKILELIVPAGWFLPVSPGTSWVTLGGAIANDVHGKNHHRAGTFGRHVTAMQLLRQGELQTISPSASAPEKASIFNATVAGLGLTGVIVTATLKLIPIDNHLIDGESIRFESLDEFFALSSASDANSEYTVAWLDCLWSKGVRGHFMRGNHAKENANSGSQSSKPWKPHWELASIPVEAPSIFVQPWTMHCFNFAYYNKQRLKTARIHQSFEPFFYPLDVINGWNKLYGKNGFFQFQCVVPHAPQESGIREVIDAARASGAGSFLAVLKEFGDLISPGILSFPRAGYTLCLDFANHGQQTLELMRRLESIVMAHGGAMYPAKDAVMSKETFRRSFSRLEEFLPFIEPRFSSDFWRRVMT